MFLDLYARLGKIGVSEECGKKLLGFGFGESQIKFATKEAKSTNLKDLLTELAKGI